MREFTPCHGLKILKYGSDTSNRLLSSQLADSSACGRISKDCKRSYVYRGNHIEVLSVADGQRISAWSYGSSACSLLPRPASYENKVAGEITCAEAIDDFASQLLLGLRVQAEAANRSVKDEGLLCVFDVATGVVVRAVKFPYPVTAISPISTDYNGCIRSEPFEQWTRLAACGSEGSLLHFAGIAAVGTEKGGIYLIDLCLDSDDACKPCELLPMQLYMLHPPLEGDSALLSQQRKECVKARLVLTVCLSAPKQGCYNYMRADNHIMKALDSSVANVTRLTFVPEMGALCVGFAFGCFQIYSISQQVLDYSSRYEETLAPVVAFAHQIPEDDPRNFCYLWVVHGADQQSNNNIEDNAYMLLYQLDYFGKTKERGFCWSIFNDLKSLTLRFEHCFTQLHEMHCDTTRTFFVSCHTLPDSSGGANSYYQHDSLDVEDVENGSFRNSGLCMFAWRALHVSQSKEKKEFTSHFAIFDINRWYHAQMPQSLRLHAGNVCPFFAQYSIDAKEPYMRTECLDIMADTGTISKYAAPIGMPFEQLLYPSTLRFAVVCTFGDCFVKAVYLGLQGQVIEDVARSGPSILLHPCAAYEQLARALIVPPSESSNNCELRERILSSMLQHGYVEFILVCVKTWATREFASESCDLRFLLHWVWSQAERLKRAFDKSAEVLFDCAGIPLDENAAGQLSDNSRQLGQLVQVLTCMQDTKAADKNGVPNTTEAGSQELAVKVAVMSLVTLYTRAVMWCHNIGILPEQCHSANDESHWIFVARHACSASRIKLIHKKAAFLAPWVHLDDVLDSADALVIDSLVASCNEQLSHFWASPGSASASVCTYPPENVHSIVSLLLLRSCDMNIKSAIFFYFILDFISVCIDGKENELSYYATEVSSLLSMSQDRANLITSFWLLDHDCIEESLLRLNDPAVIACMEPAYYVQILRMLLWLGHPAAALGIVRLRQACSTAVCDSAPLALVVLLLNGCFHEGLTFLREENIRQADNDRVTLLFEVFFDACNQAHQLDVLLTLPLTFPEEKLLDSYLARRFRQDLTVVRMLQQSRVDDAVQLNNEIRTSEILKNDILVRERSAARTAILDWYARVTPAIRQKLACADLSYRQCTRLKKEPSRPVPMSAVAARVNQDKPSAIQSSAESALSSLLLVDILDKVYEVQEYESLHKATVGSPLISSPRSTPWLCPFQQTPIIMPNKAASDRPSSVKLHARPPGPATTQPSSLKRPWSSTPFGQWPAESPLTKSIRTNDMTSTPTSDQPWSLLCTPAVRRKTPPSRMYLGNAAPGGPNGTPLFAPHSILKSRLPPASIASADTSPPPDLLRPAQVVSTAQTAASAAKKGVSFIGVGASPGSESGSSPATTVHSRPATGIMHITKRSLQAAIVPAMGLKPLKEFGLLLQTPPRYEGKYSGGQLSEECKVAESSGIGVHPICISFDEEDTEGSEEMHSAEDVMFSGTPTTSCSMPLVLEEKLEGLAAAASDTSVATAALDALKQSAEKNTSFTASDTSLMQPDCRFTQPTGDAIDKSTLATASEIPSEPGSSCVSLGAAEPAFNDGHGSIQVLNLVKDAIGQAGENRQNEIQTEADAGVEETNKEVEITSLADITAHNAMNVLAMTSGLALRNCIEASTRAQTAPRDHEIESLPRPDVAMEGSSKPGEQAVLPTVTVPSTACKVTGDSNHESALPHALTHTESVGGKEADLARHAAEPPHQARVPSAGAVDFVFSPPLSVAVPTASELGRCQSASARPFIFPPPLESTALASASLRRSSRARSSITVSSAVPALDTASGEGNENLSKRGQRIGHQHSPATEEGMPYVRHRPSFKDDIGVAVSSILDKAGEVLARMPLETRRNKGSPSASALTGETLPEVTTRSRARTRKSNKELQKAPAAPANQAGGLLPLESLEHGPDADSAVLVSDGSLAHPFRPNYTLRSSSSAVKLQLQVKEMNLPSDPKQTGANMVTGRGSSERRRDLRSTDKQLPLGGAGESDGSVAQGGIVPLLVPPSPFRDSRRRSRVPQQQLAVRAGHSLDPVTEQASPAHYATPSMPASAYLNQSQRSHRTKKTKPLPESGTPINFSAVDPAREVPYSPASRRAKAQALKSDNPSGMTLRSRTPITFKH